MSKFEVFDFITKPIEEALVPVAKEIGKTISYSWYCTFGAKAQYKGETLKLTVQKNIEDFRQELSSGINEIPPENLTEPKLSIIGPALEASKYYIEEKTLRNMFASLVASSVDNRKSNLVQPFFVEAIKQMTAADAQNIMYLSKKFNGFESFPIVNYENERTDSNGVVSRQLVLGNVLINQIENKTINADSLKICSTSLLNLQRLGLININYNKGLADFDYQVFYDTDFFNSPSKENTPTNVTREISRGHVELTQLGEDFVKVAYK